MTRIHMQTENVQSLVRQMDSAANQMEQHQEELRGCATRLSYAWRGSSHGDQYTRQIERLSSRLAGNLQKLSTLSFQLNREVEQWLEADSDGVGRFRRSDTAGKIGIGASTSIPGIIMPRPIRPVLPIYDSIKSPSGHTAYFLMHGRQDQEYEGILVGDLDDKEFEEFLKKDPFKQKLVKGEVKIWSDEIGAQAALWDSEKAWEGGGYQVGLGQADANLSGDIKYADGKFQMNSKGEVGLYAAKGEVSHDFGAVDVAAAGMVGATAAGTLGATFDPSKGRVGGKAEVDAFVGGKVEGSASVGGSVAGVETKGTVHGGLKYGAGVNAKADFGFNEGSIKAEVEIGACVGLGGELGFTVEVNVQQAAENIIDAGANAFAWANQALEAL